MDFIIGDIFWLDVEFESDPPSYYDQFKIPILNWRNNGLTKPSWVKGLFLLRYPNEYLMSEVKPDDYIMKMDENSFNYLVNELELIHGSKD